MAQTTPSLDIRKFWKTSSQTPSSPAVSSSFDTPSPSLQGAQPNVAAPVISQKKTAGGVAKAKNERGKRVPPAGNKLKLLPKLNAAATASLKPVKVDLTVTEEKANESHTVKAANPEHVDVVAEPVEEVTSEHVSASTEPVTESTELVAAEKEIKDVSADSGAVAEETCGPEKPEPAKKLRAPRKKKLSAKAIAQVEQEKLLAEQVADGAPEDAAVESGESNLVTEAVGDDVPPSLIEVKKPAKAKALTPKAKAPKPVAPVKPTAVLPAVVQDKIGYYHQKASALAEELETLQSRTVGFESDREMNLQNLIEEGAVLVAKSFSAPSPPAQSTVSAENTEGATTVCDVLSGSADPVISSLNKVVCSVLQGSCEPLSAVVIRLKQNLSDLMTAAMGMANDCSDALEEEGPALDLTAMSVSLLSKYPDSRLLLGVFNFESQSDAISLLCDEIKSIAVRESHGHRAKDCVSFENTEALSLWSWEVNKTSVFSNAENALITECRSIRKRYGRAVKAFVATIEQLEKFAALGHTKVLQVEERASKAFAEVEKSKEKRLEVERKKQSDRIEKARREEKLREKEEFIRLKKESAAKESAAVAERKREAEARASEAKAAAAAEKKLQEDKLAKKLEKQRNMLQSFLVSKPAPSEISVSVPAESAPVAAAGVDTPSGSCEGRKRRYDEDEFEKYVMRGSMSHNEMLCLHRRRYLDMKEAEMETPKAKRRKIKIQVPVEVGGGDAFGAETYTEIVDKYVDGKMKLFQFHEYEKVKYWGTFSKKSSIVKGRTFYKKDESLRNYDVDSAEEWEDEEEVGEDIIESDDDMDVDEPNEPNELVFDDFFRHDDDFGSDAEEDSEEGQRPAVQRPVVVGKSVAGPRFICTSPVQHVTTAAAADFISPANREISVAACSFDKDGAVVNCNETDRDVSRLLPFFTVVYPPVEPLVVSVNVPTAEATGVSAPSPVDDGAEGSAAEKGGRTLAADQTRAFATFIHGKKCGIDKLVEALKVDFPDLPKSFISRNIKDLAAKEKGADGIGSSRWVVNSTHASELQLELPALEYTPPKQRKRIAPTSVTSLTPMSALFAPEKVENSSTVEETKNAKCNEAAIGPSTIENKSSTVSPSSKTKAASTKECVAEKSTAAVKSVNTSAAAKPAVKNTLVAFFKKGGSAPVKTEDKQGDEPTTPGMDAEIMSPDRGTEDRSVGSSNTPLNFDVFDRLIGTPNTTPYVKVDLTEERENKMDVAGADSSELFGEADDDISLLDLPCSPSLSTA